MTFRKETRMNFGIALALLKVGKRVSRDGWNGKGMFIYMVGEGRYPPSTPAGELIASTQSDGLVPYKPYLAIRCVDGEVVPWLASQTDILASDWSLAPGEEIDLDTIDAALADHDAENALDEAEAQGSTFDESEDSEGGNIFVVFSMGEFFPGSFR